MGYPYQVKSTGFWYIPNVPFKFNTECDAWDYIVNHEASD